MHADAPRGGVGRAQRPGVGSSLTRRMIATAGAAAERRRDRPGASLLAADRSASRPSRPCSASPACSSAAAEGDGAQAGRRPAGGLLRGRRAQRRSTCDLAAADRGASTATGDGHGRRRAAAASRSSSTPRARRRRRRRSPTWSSRASTTTRLPPDRSRASSSRAATPRDRDRRAGLLRRRAAAAGSRSTRRGSSRWRRVAVEPPGPLREPVLRGHRALTPACLPTTRCSAA